MIILALMSFVGWNIRRFQILAEFDMYVSVIGFFNVSAGVLAVYVGYSSKSIDPM